VGAPAFVQAGTGQVWASGAAVAATLACTAGNIVVFHVLKDGNGVGGTVSSISNVEDLAGTDNAMTELAGESVNTSATPVAAVASERQYIWIGRSLGGTASVSYSDASGNDGYFRLYEFSGANAGTTLADVIENGTAGTATGARGTAAQIDDTGVTTLAPNRLALNFIGVNDDNNADFDTEAFTGMTGGTWASNGSYGSATGTDGAIGLQSATMASAGTIDGGALTMAASDGWGVIGFALKGIYVPDVIYATGLTE
jgi:hypothetical protein